jgi:hypothetical protein
MTNTQLLIKYIINEMTDREWKTIKEDLQSGLTPYEKGEGSGDDATGLNDHEAMLIRKLARKTEELHRLFRNDTDEGTSENSQE